VVRDAVPHLPREVQALENLDDPHGLEVVPEPRVERGDHLLAEVTEGRMAEIVPQADRLDQVFVEAERPGDGPRHLGDLERVGQADPVMVALGCEEYLGLVTQAAERLAVNDPIPVHLEGGPKVVLGLGVVPPLGPGDRRGELGQVATLDVLGPRPDGLFHAPEATTGMRRVRFILQVAKKGD
jgi:hypothetical protein